VTTNPAPAQKDVHDSEYIDYAQAVTCNHNISPTMVTAVSRHEFRWSGNGPLGSPRNTEQQTSHTYHKFGDCFRSRGNGRARSRAGIHLF
jgi:hypothetical protein